MKPAPCIGLFLSVLFGLLTHGAGDSLHSLRDLAIGDFKELNALIKGAVIRLPDGSLSADMVSFYMSNLRCQDFQIGDVLLSSKKDTSQQVTVPLRIVDLDMVCRFDYRYNAALIFNGGGGAEVFSYDNDAFTSMTLTSPDLSKYPPDTLSFETCEATININDLNFSGGIVGWVLNRIEGAVRNKIATEAQAKLCETLDTWSETKIADWLRLAKEKLGLFPSSFRIDPLQMENSLTPPDFVNLLNIQEKETGVGKWFHLALDEAVAYLRAESYDLDARPTDMNVNIILRNHVLEERALVINIEDLPFAQINGLLFEGTDKLTKTSIWLNSVKVMGLDTFIKFEPLVDIGSYTLQNKLAWEHLTFEVDVTFDIKPSNREDSVIVNPGSTNVVERVKIAFKIDQADAIFSIMMAVDQGLLESVELGSLLNTDKIAPCLLSTIFDVGVSGFELNVRDIEPPTLVGFVSPGIDRVVSSFVDAAFLTYRDVLLERLPSFFQKAVRDFVNENILSKYWSQAESKVCSWTQGEPSLDDGLIDVRDLFLPPFDAAAAGGSGTEPYGDLFSSLLVPMLDSKFLPNDDDGLPLLNSRLVRPLTKLQSGNEGSLFFPSDLFYFQKEDPTETSSSLLQKIELRAFNSSISNLDTITSPLSLLKPTEAHLLTNEINIGPVPNEPLILSTRFLLSVAGDNSPLDMLNHVELSMKIPSSELLLDIFAAIQKQRLLTLPLKGMDNYHCWLDTMAGSEGVDNKNVYERKAMDLQRFFVTLSTLDIGVKCVECTSAGVRSFPDILDVLQNAGLSVMFQPRLERLAEEIVWGYWQLLEVDRMLLDAPNRCPSSPRFDGDSFGLEEHLTTPDIDAPRLSLDAVETVVAFGAIIAETAMIVVAKSHLSATSNITNPLSGQAALEGDRTNFLDWTKLDGIVGDWIKSAIDNGREYLAGEVEDSNSNGAADLGANILIRSFLLGDDGALSFNFDNMGTDIGGAKITLEKMRIQGLDSVTRIGSFFDAIAPQTLQNDLTFSNLVVTFVIGINVIVGDERPLRQDDTKQMSLSFGLSDVNANFALLLAADLDKLGALEMGSILHMEDIVPCILSRLDDVQITQLLVSVGSIDEPTVEGFLSPKFRYDIASVLRKTLSAFSADLVAAIPYILDDTVRNMLNGMLRDARRDSDRICDWSNALPDAGLLDFRDLFLQESLAQEWGGSGTSPYGDLFRVLWENMNSRFLNAETLNDFLRSWTKSQSGIAGSAWKQGEVFNSSVDISFGNLEADAQFVVSDAQVENMDTVGEPLAILTPINGVSNVLNNVASFGVGSKNFRVSGRALISLSDGNELNLHNELDVGLSLRSLSYALSFFLNIPHSRLYEFPLKDVFNINCWLVTVLSPPPDSPYIPSAGIVGQEVKVEELDINVECHECSSPNFDELISHLYSPGDSDGGGSLLTKLSSQILGGGFLRDRLLIDAAKQCPHNSAYDPDAAWGESILSPTETMAADKAKRDEKAMLFNVAMGVVTFVILLLVVSGKWVHRRRHRKWVESLDNEGASILRQQESKEEKKEIALNETMTSMFCSLDIPRHIRWGVPFVIIADIGLFLGGHLAPISYLDVEGTVAGETFTLYRFLDFSFFSSAIRSYQNGGNEMAVFILIFSGIWPYVKLLILAVAWFLPPQRLSVSRRGSILLWMDVLAKLSIIDIITMLLLGAVILVFIGGPGEVFSESNGLYSLKAIVTPGAGFYCFVVAQRISRISSRYLLDWHRRIVRQHTKEYETRHCLHTADTLFDSLEHSISSEERKEEDKSRCSSEHDHMEIQDSPDIASHRKSVPVSEKISSAETSLGNHTASTLKSLGWSNSAEECKEEISPSSMKEENHNTPHIASNYVPKSVLLEEKKENNVGSSSPATASTFTSAGCSSKSTPEGTKSRVHKSVSLSNNDDNSSSDNSSQDQGRGCITGLSRIGGTAGVVFSSITVLAVFIIGCVLAPAISLNTKAIWELALESGKTFSQATQASVFRVVTMILLQARFVLRTTRDYIAFGILFGLVAISSFLFPFTQAIIKFGKWRAERKKRKKGLLPPKKKKKKLPAYIERIYLWKGMEVYIISFVIAIWQLGAISAYVIHLYCTILSMIFDTLSYLGLTLTDKSQTQCFRVQASLPLTIFAICACFGLLSVTFLLQALGNYKENRRHVETLIQNDTSLSITTRSSFWNLDSSQILVRPVNSDDTFSADEESRSDDDRSQWLPSVSKLLRLPRMMNRRYGYFRDRQGSEAAI